MRDLHGLLLSLLGLHLGEDVANEGLEVHVHLVEGLHALHCLSLVVVHLGVLVDLRDGGTGHAAAYGLLADASEALGGLGHLALLALEAHAGQLRQVRVSIALLLFLGDPAERTSLHVLLSRQVPTDSGLVELALDFGAGERHALSSDFISALLQVNLKGAQAPRALGGLRLRVGVGHVVLHPVDVEGAGLLAVRRSASVHGD